MIPEKTPTLAAIAWITVVLAYAWASNRDYDDAVRVGASFRARPHAVARGDLPPTAERPPSRAKARSYIAPVTTGEKP
jgi:hypothetical protein